MSLKKPNDRKECLKGKERINCGNCKDFGICRSLKAQTKIYEKDK